MPDRSEPDVPRTARDRARALVTADITRIARRQLAETGPTALSLRAVARELGMASSAVYRYFPSRDDLLTVLIVEAYDALGEAAERADRAAVADGAGSGARWLRTCRAVRAWALAHPQEWALVYGSPVVGYAAPVDTIGPATRIAAALAAIVRDALTSGDLDPSARDLGTEVLLDSGTIELVAGSAVDEFPDDLVARSLSMWVSLVGAVSFELFGHFHDVVTDLDRYFDSSMVVAAEAIGLTVLLD